MKRIKQTFLIVTLVLSLCGSFLIAGSVMAADSTCGGADTSIIKCDENNEGKDITNNGVWALLMLVVNIMTGAVAVAAIGGVAYAAVMYASAGGSVEKTKKAIEVIMNVIVGIVLYAIAWALMNWLIPGGVLFQ
jgi:hypothetical protein